MTAAIKRVGKNPLDWALERLGLTRVEFQVQGGYNKSYLLRLSQGRTANMSERVVTDLYRIAEEKGVDLDAELDDVGDLESAYELWVFRHRSAQIMPDPVSDTDMNPFMRLVMAVGSVARMSALLAAPDQLVERYAKGVSYVMPYPIREALVAMGYPHRQHLEDAMTKWGEDHA